jgi:ankyrin repeat protein
MGVAPRALVWPVAAAIALAGCGSSDDADPPDEPAPRDGAAVEKERGEPSTERDREATEEPSPELDRQLIEAARRGDTAAARELIEAGADVNAKDETEQSAYLLAASEGYAELLDLTLENGADVNSKDSFNGTALIRAAERGHVEVVDRLLETDVEIDHVNELGWTALMEAVIRGPGGPRHTEVVRLLVEAGADSSIPDDAGVTPLAHAEQLGYMEIADILREAGAEG